MWVFSLKHPVSLMAFKINLDSIQESRMSSLTPCACLSPRSHFVYFWAFKAFEAIPNENIKCVSNKFQGCFKSVLRVFQGSFKGGSWKFQGCTRGVSRKFHAFKNSFQTGHKVFCGSLKDVSGKLQKCLKPLNLVLKSFKDISIGGFKGISWKFHRCF